MLIGACGTFNVVGPITIAYREPIINPITAYIVWDGNFSNESFIHRTNKIIPVRTPNPKIISAGKTIAEIAIIAATKI